MSELQGKTYAKSLAKGLLAGMIGGLVATAAVAARLAENCFGDRGIQSLNQRHDRDDRRHRDDVAEHRHERPELRRPDRREREAGGFEEMAHGLELQALPLPSVRPHAGGFDLDRVAVAHAADRMAAILGNFRLDQRRDMLGEAAMRLFLVGAHETAVADQIRP